MKVTTMKEATDWFIKNPGRGVTVEYNGNAINCTSLEQAEKIFSEAAKPKKEVKE